MNKRISDIKKLTKEIHGLSKHNIDMIRLDYQISTSRTKLSSQIHQPTSALMFKFIKKMLKITEKTDTENKI